MYIETTGASSRSSRTTNDDDTERNRAENTDTDGLRLKPTYTIYNRKYDRMDIIL